MSKSIAYERVVTLRDDLIARKEVFNQADLHAAAMESCEDLKESALEGLVAWAIEKVDRTPPRTHSPDEQMTFGEFNLDVVLKLGGGDRILKRHAQLKHFRAWLAISATNRAAVDRSDDREHEQLEMLISYWEPSMRMEEAIMEYYAAVPAHARDRSVFLAEEAHP